MRDIGRFDYPIDFVTYDSVSDGYGGTADTQTGILHTWSEKTPLSSGKELSENQVVLNATNRYRVRMRSGFTPTVKMKVLDRGTLFSIISVIPVVDQRYWEIRATDQTSG